MEMLYNLTITKKTPHLLKINIIYVLKYFAVPHPLLQFNSVNICKIYMMHHYYYLNYMTPAGKCSPSSIRH